MVTAVKWCTYYDALACDINLIRGLDHNGNMHTLCISYAPRNKKNGCCLFYRKIQTFEEEYQYLVVHGYTEYQAWKKRMAKERFRNSSTYQEVCKALDDCRKEREKRGREKQHAKR